MPVALDQLVSFIVPQGLPVGLLIPERKRSLVAGAVDDRVDIIQVCVVGEYDSAVWLEFSNGRFPRYSGRRFVAIPLGLGAPGYMDGVLGGRDQVGGDVVAGGGVANDNDSFVFVE